MEEGEGIALLLRILGVFSLILAFYTVMVGLTWPLGLYSWPGVDYRLYVPPYDLFVIILSLLIFLTEWTLYLLLWINLSKYIVRKRQVRFFYISYLVLSFITRIWVAVIVGGFLEDQTYAGSPMLLGTTSVAFALIALSLLREPITIKIKFQLRILFGINLILGLQVLIWFMFDALPDEFILLQGVVIGFGFLKMLATIYSANVFFYWSTIFEIPQSLKLTGDVLETPLADEVAWPSMQ